MFQSGDRDDVVERSLVAATVTATTTPTEAKVGATRLVARQTLTIQNKGSQAIYYGPSGSTPTNGGIIVFKDQTVFLPYGDLPVFIYTASGTATVVIQEVG